MLSVRGRGGLDGIASGRAAKRTFQRQSYVLISVATYEQIEDVLEWGWRTHNMQHAMQQAQAQAQTQAQAQILKNMQRRYERLAAIGMLAGMLAVGPCLRQNASSAVGQRLSIVFPSAEAKKESKWPQLWKLQPQPPIASTSIVVARSGCTTTLGKKSTHALDSEIGGNRQRELRAGRTAETHRQ